MLIGVTGQIGTGKTTAVAVFKKMGAAVIDADRIGREVVNKNKKLRTQLASGFGKQILTRTGKLRRSRLADLAFLSAANKKLLDKLVHPYLLKELRKQVERLSRNHQVVVIDAALLLDWNLHRVVDRVLVVHCALEKRIARLIKRGIKSSDFLARMKRQLPLKKYKKHADRIILNNSTKIEFDKKVANWAKQFFRQ